ncbi:MAG: hypothetical protein A3J76_02215 [Candidatus Moranbacteria bacterium RBG_13_45_13]|nr:MAG: hypothetical protein A3J76_02215 [Candidatus Moranbacteria bacterium RBG_13_45_13]
MREDFKKNFVLLSRVAKEKKYAQEYLGLLARRGDLGSIRIGKRWYTTQEWFWEFLKDAEIRKAEIKAMETLAVHAEESYRESEKTEKVSLPEKVELESMIKIKKSFIEEQNIIPKSAIKEEKQKSHLLKEEPRFMKIDERIKEARIEKAQLSRRVLNFQAIPEKRFETIDLRKANMGKPLSRRTAMGAVNGVEMAKKERMAKSPKVQEEKTQQWETIFGESSPNFAAFDGEISFFPKFAFSASAVLILVLLFQIGWVFQDKVKNLSDSKSGIVAGAEDSKISLRTVKNLSSECMENERDSFKENISSSRVLLGAAVERNNKQGSPPEADPLSAEMINNQ